MRLVLPESVWARLLDEFARQRPGVERIAFLDGYRTDEAAVVTTITVPDATCEPGYYTVTADQMQQAGKHFREYGMARLAQVHTHGNRGLAHSGRDDEMAYSHRDGAVSIVLPEHAAHRPAPLDGLVHVKTGASWRALDAAEAAKLIVIVPSLLDHRRSVWRGSHRGTQAISAGHFGRLRKRLRLLFAWRSRRS